MENKFSDLERKILYKKKIMKVAIVNHNSYIESANEKISNKIEKCFCGRFVPYKIQKDEAFEDGKHIGVFLLDEKNPELINKIINLIKDESRKNMGKD